MADKNEKNHRVRILPPITWNQFLEHFESSEEFGDEIIREFFNHLSEKFVPKPVTFSKKERSIMHCKETAKGIFNLMKIVEDIKDKIGTSKLSNIRIKKLLPYSYGYDFHSPTNKNTFGSVSGQSIGIEKMKTLLYASAFIQISGIIPNR